MGRVFAYLGARSSAGCDEAVWTRMTAFGSWSVERSWPVRPRTRASAPGIAAEGDTRSLSGRSAEVAADEAPERSAGRPQGWEFTGA
jgi:hypothetical protein